MQEKEIRLFSMKLASVLTPASYKAGQAGACAHVGAILLRLVQHTQNQQGKQMTGCVASNRRPSCVTPIPGEEDSSANSPATDRAQCMERSGRAHSDPYSSK